MFDPAAILYGFKISSLIAIGEIVNPKCVVFSYLVHGFGTSHIRNGPLGLKESFVGARLTRRICPHGAEGSEASKVKESDMTFALGNQ